MAPRRVVVVGAGIMGTSTAFWLHRAGWDVTLLDAGRVPNPAGSSGGVHRLIRTTYGGEIGYTRMVVEAYPVWDEVEEVVGQRLLWQTGMLAVDTVAGTFGADTRAVLDGLDLPHELLDHDELAVRFPQFRLPPGATALHTDDAHFIRARDAVGAMATWLQDHGATVRDRTPVVAVDPDRGRVVLADGAWLGGDRVVVAAGPWTSDLLGGAAPDLTPSRQVVVDLGVPDHLRAAWAGGPAFLVQPAYGIPPRDGLPLKVGDHGFSLEGHPDDDRDPTADEVRAVLEVAGEALVDIDAYELLEARSCYYTVRRDERFVVRPLGSRGVLLAGFSGHGFKFGPLVGRRVAAALEGHAQWDDVTPWAAGSEVSR